MSIPYNQYNYKEKDVVTGGGVSSTPKQEPKSPIIFIGGDTIDLRRIYRVAKVIKREPDDFYCVCFDGNQDNDLTVLTKTMTREKFIALWKEAVKG